jgi:hypothetical protein
VQLRFADALVLHNLDGFGHHLAEGAQLLALVLPVDGSQVLSNIVRIQLIVQSVVLDAWHQVAI